MYSMLEKVDFHVSLPEGMIYLPTSTWHARHFPDIGGWSSRRDSQPATCKPCQIMLVVFCDTPPKINMKPEKKGKKVWFRWFSFSNRWFSGSILIFQGFGWTWEGQNKLAQKWYTSTTFGVITFRCQGKPEYIFGIIWVVNVRWLFKSGCIIAQVICNENLLDPGLCLGVTFCLRNCIDVLFGGWFGVLGHASKLHKITESLRATPKTPTPVESVLLLSYWFNTPGKS